MLLSALVLLLSAARAFSDQCTYKQLPIFIGGTSNEYVNCLVYDEVNNMIIVGGNTTSTQFAPAANDHAFLVGLDMEGNWQWGKFFYNVTSALSTISGCKMASDGQSLTLMGVANSQPIMLDINAKDGSIQKFLSLEYTELTDSNVPTIVTYGAILHDKVDFFDSQEYVYEAFLMDSKVQMVRVWTPDQQTPKIDWSFEFYDFSSSEASADLVRRKDPAFITTNPRD